MKKIASFLAILTVSISIHAAQNQSLKLVTVSTYLNFYLLNLNACEDFHPSVRDDAYIAEGKLAPYLRTLYKKVSESNISDENKAAIKKTATDRRAKLNQQIDEGEFTVEHCNAVIGIVNEGLDSELLNILK